MTVLKKSLFILFTALLLLAPWQQTSFAAPAGDYKVAFVERIIDPFTLEVSIGRQLHTVRLLGVSPLDGLKPGQQKKLKELKAEQYAASFLLRTWVYLEFDVDNKDSADRLLAYVWLEKPEKKDQQEIGTKMYNGRLLRDGYGQWSLDLPNYKYSSSLRSLSEEAQKQHLGIWSGQ